MKPTKHLYGAALNKAMEKIVRIQFEDVGELTKHEDELSIDTQSYNSTYNTEQWDDLCQRHGIDGDSQQDW